MRNFLACSLLMLLCFTACDSNRVYDEYKSLPGYWQHDSIVSFQLKNIDSLTPYNLFINIRNNNTYKYSNLFLITKMSFPNGKQVVDTLQYDMAYPDGTLMGNGYGDVKESKLWYKEGVEFPEQGNYTVSIQQAMRKNGKVEGIDSLEGITEVGFRIEKPTK